MTDQNTALALEPCPFCGAAAKHVERSNPMSKWRHSIDCTKCGMSGPVEATKAEAITAWNTRTPAPAPVAVGGDELRLEWRKGPPPKPWAEEWFIAETIYRDRVVLTALPEEYSYDFKTADETYMKAENVKRWMQFPDSGYIAPDLQTHPTASTAQPVSSDWFNPETDGTDCPSCGGQNTSCPDGCGREPETGELNGTRLETAQPDDLERLLGRITCTAETSARLMRDAKNTGDWWGAENTAKNFDIIAKQTDDLRAALAVMQQQAFCNHENAESVVKIAERSQPQPDAAVAVERERWQPIESAPHNQCVILAWQDWRDGTWSMEVGPASTGERFSSGFSSVSRHGSATHWQPRPAPPAAICAGGQPS